jgi:CHASE2 domain-containing sensor protein
MKKEIKENLFSIQHLLVAVILMTKGYDKVTHYHNFIGWTILVFGILISGYFILIKLTKIEKVFFEPIVHLAESIALLLTSYVYFKEGKTFLPYITLIAGIGFLIAVILHLLKHKKKLN